MAMRGVYDMTDDEKDQLKTVGIDVEDAMDRFMNNEELYAKFLLKFLEDKDFEEMKVFLEEGNCQDAFTSGHTVKGVTGNLSINGLYYIIVPFVEYLRNGNLEAAREHFPELEKAYNDSINMIRILQ
ncbi:MAG: Hpt domain-containing protein [Lachnospiraceae bacterium]|nr:Hpt domain-containing protein [Lachnospiraceae bacterium]